MGLAAASIAGGGGLLGLIAGNDASSAQRSAAADAANQVNAGKSQALGYLQPYSNAGSQALSPLTSLLLGKSYDTATGQFTDVSPGDRLNSFFQSPAYQFNLTQGLQAVNKSQVAKGNSLSGGALKEINDYAQGQASNEYGTDINQLFQLAGIGQTAATGQANAALGAGSQLGQIAYAGGMGNVNKFNNLSNFGFGLAGLGTGSALSSGGSPGGSGNTGSTYNSSYFNSAGSNFLSPSTALSSGAAF